MPDGHWGNDLVHKDPDIFRYFFVNIRGLPNQANHEKHDLIIQTIKDLSIDFMGMAEINLNPPTLQPRAQWKDRFRQLRTHKRFAYNQHANQTIRDLYGGTAHITSPEASHRVEESGDDRTGLGRWTWVQLTGRGGIKTRIVTGYRPNEDTSDRAGSVYSQHQQEFIRKKQHREPRKAFLEDLRSQVEPWMENGEQIIIGIDLNDDTWDSEAATYIESWGLVNTLKDKHPDLPKTATYDRNTQNKPIDGVWSTPGLDVAAAGMLAFGTPNLDSCDHRVLWVDFTTDSMYGYRPPALQSPLDLGVPLGDPGQVEAINSRLKKERIKANIPNQILFLERRARDKVYDHDDDMLYNKLLEQDFEIRKRLLKHLRKKYAGQVEYSDVIGYDRKELYLYSLALKRADNRRMDTRKIRRLMTKLQKPTVLQMSKLELQSARERCMRRYHQHKKEQRELRQAFAKKVYQRRAATYNTSVATQEKIATNAFRQKGTFRQIRMVMNPSPRAGIKYVERTNTAGEEEACYSRDEIETACCEEGYKRYSQANTTPFMQHPLVDELGFLGKQEVIDQIIRGTYQIPPGVDEYTRALIDAMKAPPGALEEEPITGYTTTQEHSAGWKKIRSNTSASPFGTTMSEYIAGAQNKDIAEIDAAMASIPSLTGIAPSFWAKGVDVMIPKKAASKRVEKLRIIVLFHALFNQFNKRVARRVMARAESLGAIASEICGGRYRHRSVECGLNKTLALDVTRQRHLPAILCSNDAKSCYDRIIHSVANICLQRLGVDSKTCSVMFGTLQAMRHHVKTAFGVSTKHYGCIELPLQGVLQGNGAGPAIWLVVSMPLVQMLKRQGYGLRLKNTMNDEEYQFSCFTFVDDTDMIHVGSDTQLFSEVLNDMQGMIDLWAGGLHATGGKLVVKDKSYWYGIDFMWNKTKCTWEYKRLEQLQGELTLDVQGATRTNIERLDVHTARETLGMWTTVTGCQKKQEQEMLKKVQHWGDKIRTKQLTKTAAWLSLRTGITKSLQYPLTNTRLSKKACGRIDKALRKLALPALGIPQSFPLELTYAPREVLGLGIPRMWTQQAIDHITCILRHADGPSTDSTGNLIRDAMATLRLELGLPGHPFQHSYKRFSKTTTPIWLHIAWEFCYDHGLYIQDTQNQLELRRVDDAFIMQAFDEHGFTESELHLLNACRTRLRVITIADLATGDGRALSRRSRGQRNPVQHNNHLDWVKAGEPSAKAWKLWDQALETAFLHPDDRHYRLRRSLGPWIRAPPQWGYWYSVATQDMYHRIDSDHWAVYRSVETARPSHFINTEMTTTDIPTDSQPTTVVGQDVLRMEGYRHIKGPHPDESEESPDREWWGRIHHMPSTLTPLLQGIRAGTAVCLTDGSFKDKHGTAAFILLPDIGYPEGVTCVNQTPGYDTDIDPYRSELGGIYGCIQLVNRIMKRYGLDHGSVTLGCDCKSAGNNLFINTYEDPKQPHFDLLHGARKILEDSPAQWTYHYVPGHQDDHKNYRNLDRWGQLNVDMDTLAKAYWTKLDAEGWRPFSLPPVREWSLWRNGKRLTTWNTKTATQLVHTTPAKQYWHKKLQVSLPVTEMAWTAQKLAATSLPDYRKLWHMKWLTNRVATNGNLHKWGISTTAVCPRCGQDEKHRTHVILCPSESVNLRWDAAMDHLKSWMLDNQAQPDLAEGLVIGLNAWHTHTTPHFSESTWPGVNAAIANQANVGWARTFDGIFHESWVATQHSYTVWLNRRTTGHRWVSRLIMQLWEIAWDLWRHRMDAAAEPTSASIAATHDALNADIDERYCTFAHCHPPILARFFARDPELLHTETIQFKQQWITFVDQAVRFYELPEVE